MTEFFVLRLLPRLLVVVRTVLVAVLAAACASPAPVAEPIAAEPAAATTPVEVPSTPAPTRPARPDSLLPLVPPVDPADPATVVLEAELGEGLADDGELEMAAAQRRLTELRYYAGPVDGQHGPATTTAVQAFQKTQDLPVDGELGPDTIAALADPVLPGIHAGAANRIDIDLDAQVLFVVLDGRLERIMPISSGNGEPYPLPGGIRAVGLTPTGTFQIERKLPGNVNAFFGRLYDPMYFHEGWAIHGSNNVPAVPASHGCVRLPVADAEWLFDQVEVGTPVTVWGELNAFNPAAGETAGTITPAGDTGPAPLPPPPPPGPAFG